MRRSLIYSFFGLLRSCRRVSQHLLCIPVLLTLHQRVDADLEVCSIVIAARLLWCFETAASGARTLIMQRCLLDGDHGWSTDVFHHQIFIVIGKNVLLLVPILLAKVHLVTNKVCPGSLLLMMRLANVMAGLWLIVQISADGGSLKRVSNRARIADGLLVGVRMQLLVLL